MAGKITHEYLVSNSQHDLFPFKRDLTQVPAQTKVINADFDVFTVLWSVRPDLKFARGMDAGFDDAVNPGADRLFEFIRRSNISAADRQIALDKIRDVYEVIL